MTPVIVYTDGACIGNPGPGGWAWAEVGRGAWASGPVAHTTNQKMEIRAALEAATSHRGGPVVIVTDSTYVLKCFQDAWYVRWLKNGWIGTNKKPVSNREHWEPLVAEFLDRGGPDGEIKFSWVKGHGGDPMNDLVDRLAAEAARTQQPGRGDEPPAVLPEADRPYR